MEAVRLRVQDIDFQMKQITVRAGKSEKDRITTFPGSVTPPLQTHLARTKTMHPPSPTRHRHPHQSGPVGT